MFSMRVRWGSASRLGLVLLLAMGASACKQEVSKSGKKLKQVPCDQTIKVDPSKGAYPLAGYVCENDTVTWDSGGGHKFQVEFKAGSPFVNGKAIFNNQDPSGQIKDHYDQLEVYKYTITVDTTNVFDPQVVGGGNP